MIHNRNIVAISVFFISIVVFGLCGPNTASGATREDRILDLRRQIEELTRQAEQFRNNVLTRQNEANTLSREISILNNRIAALKTEIALTTHAIESAEIEILELEKEIFDASQSIARHKEAIGNLMLLMYERQHMSLVAVLLSAQRISDFTNEAQQIETINARLASLVNELKHKKDMLEYQKESLRDKKSDLEELADKQLNQRNSLSSSRTDKDRVLGQTKGEEERYQDLLNDVERKKAEFFQQLQALESEARETGSFIVHVAAPSVPPRGTVLFQWPYESFVITQGYGYTSYARRGSYGGAPHNGIDVVSGYASPIRAIADGNVLTAGLNSGFGYWVAIEHDNGMVSLYAHMNAPARLGNGTRVKAGDIIGFEGSTGNSTGSHLHLSLFRDFFTYIRESNGQLYFNYFEGTLNPIDYLAKR